MQAACERCAKVSTAPAYVTVPLSSSSPLLHAFEFWPSDEMACLVPPMPLSSLGRQSPVSTEPLSNSDYASRVLVDPQRSLSVLLGMLDTDVRPAIELAQPRMLA